VISIDVNESSVISIDVNESSVISIDVNESSVTNFQVGRMTSPRQEHVVLPVPDMTC
jgi:hypothetical protein